MPEHQPIRRVYLDIDGVILPHNHKSDGDLIQTTPGGPLIRRTELHGGLEPEWLNKDEFYYPAIARRFGELAMRGVEIPLASSRSLEVMLSYPPLIEDLGGMDHFVLINNLRNATANNKAEAILNNWQGVVDTSVEKAGWTLRRSLIATPPTPPPPGSRAAWVEDFAELKNLKTPRAQEILRLDTLKVIQPLGYLGVTMAQLDELEAFLFDE